jgi:hypothetical protein
MANCELDSEIFDKQIVRPLNLEIFSDEILTVRDNHDNSKWMYFGTLIVQKEKKDQLLQQLNNLRCIKSNNWHPDISTCEDRCGYHDKNNTEIHYKELDESNARFRIAQNWLKFVRDERSPKTDRLFYFNILGLNLSAMNLEMFGEGSNDLTIYNRFYRTTILGGLNYFFKGRKIIIHNIFHDRGSQEVHRYIPWHAIHKIDLTNENTSIIPESIQFIDSDHRKSGKEESHLIQLIDILLGATYACLHNPSVGLEKRKIGYFFKPVLTCLLDRKKTDYGPMSGTYYKSKFYRTSQVSFFPKNKFDMNTAPLDGYNFDRRIGNGKFYYERQIQVMDPSEATLDQWF